MLSYHNDPVVKLKYQARFEAHRKADDVIQGTGYDNGRGCFVGCTLNKYDHSRFPVELGWPEWLARLADSIFEGIPKSEAPQFGTDLLDAVQIGKDLEPVKWHLAIARHKVQIERLKDNSEPYAEHVRNALQSVIVYCQSELTNTATEEMAESAARSAARSAAESARSAAESAAWSAWSAWSAAESTWSARSAAESAESTWSARSAAWQFERDTLLTILREM